MRPSLKAEGHPGKVMPTLCTCDSEDQTTQLLAGALIVGISQQSVMSDLQIYSILHFHLERVGQAEAGAGSPAPHWEVMVQTPQSPRQGPPWIGG